MNEFPQFTLGGVSFGMVYAAIALSLVLIWRGTRILNYSQGAMAVLTTYIALTVINHTGSYWAGFVVALAAGLVLGAVIERVVIRPVENRPPLNAVVVTIGLLVLIEGIAGIIYGGQYRSFPAAFSVTGLHAGSVTLGISRNDVFVAAAVLVVALALAAMFRYTSAGLRLRAAAFNAYAARLLGVRVGRVLTLGWALAGLIGAGRAAGLAEHALLLPPAWTRSCARLHRRGDRRPDSPVGAIVGGLILGVVLNYVGGTSARTWYRSSGSSRWGRS